MPDVAGESWPRKPVGPSKRLLAEVVLDLIELGGTEVARAYAETRAAKAAAEASVKRTLEFHTPSKYFGQWWEAVSRPTAQPRCRGSPRAAHPAPPSEPERLISPEERAAVRADLARFMETHL